MFSASDDDLPTFDGSASAPLPDTAAAEFVDVPPPLASFHSMSAGFGSSLAASGFFDDAEPEPLYRSLPAGAIGGAGFVPRMFDDEDGPVYRGMAMFAPGPSAVAVGPADGDAALGSAGLPGKNMAATYGGAALSRSFAAAPFPSPGPALALPQPADDTWEPPMLPGIPFRLQASHVLFASGMSGMSGMGLGMGSVRPRSVALAQPAFVMDEVMKACLRGLGADVGPSKPGKPYKCNGVVYVDSEALHFKVRMYRLPDEKGGGLACEVAKKRGDACLWFHFWRQLKEAINDTKMKQQPQQQKSKKNSTNGTGNKKNSGSSSSSSSSSSGKSTTAASTVMPPWGGSPLTRLTSPVLPVDPDIIILEENPADSATRKGKGGSGSSSSSSSSKARSTTIIDAVKNLVQMNIVATTAEENMASMTILTNLCGALASTATAATAATATPKQQEQQQQQQQQVFGGQHAWGILGAVLEVDHVMTLAKHVSDRSSPDLCRGAASLLTTAAALARTLTQQQQQQQQQQRPAAETGSSQNSRLLSVVPALLAQIQHLGPAPQPHQAATAQVLVSLQSRRDCASALGAIADLGPKFRSEILQLGGLDQMQRCVAYGAGAGAGAMMGTTAARGGWESDSAMRSICSEVSRSLGLAM